MKKKYLFVIIFSLLTSLYAFTQENILDTHIHLYDTEREGSFDFLDDHASSGSDVLRFPHLARTFLDSAGPAGVQFGYVVEASLQREDNFWLSLITDTSDCLLGFSANLDPRVATYRSDLDSLMQNPKFRGIRPRVRGLNLGDVSVQKQFVELARRNLVLELWGNSSDIATIARMYPNMNIIVNHFAGGTAPEGGVSPADYSNKLAVLAAEPNVYLKISALYTLSRKLPAPTLMAYYKPLIDAAVDAFGPDRVLYGSNWSLSGLRGPYSGMIELLKAYCDQRDDLSRDQLFYDNAVKAYGLITDDVEHPGKGNGLLLSYWNGKAGGRSWWTDSITTSFIPNLDMYWEKSPAPGVNENFWNACFVGNLEPLFTGSHRFYFTINDYAKLWVDDLLVFDGWGGSYSNLCHTFKLDLVEGQKVAIRAEYANTTGDGFARLEWESEAFSREVIPQSQFYSDVDTSSTSAMKESESGMQGIRIYPNPANGLICINCQETGVCEVYNLTGRKLDAFSIDSNLVERDTSTWPAGIYFLQFRTRNSSFFKKILVNHKS
jgi:L-fuconolactonase